MFVNRFFFSLYPYIPPYLKVTDLFVCACFPAEQTGSQLLPSFPLLQLNPHSREPLRLEPHCALIKDAPRGLHRRTHLVHLCHLPHRTHTTAEASDCDISAVAAAQGRCDEIRSKQRGFV